MSAPAEVFRRETEGGAVVFYSLPRDVPASPSKSGGAPVRPLSSGAVSAMRAARLLKSLAKVAAHRRAVGFVGSAAWGGVLDLAAEMIRARAFHGDKPVGECDLRKWAAVHVPEAGHGAIAAAWAESEGGGVVPSPAQAGAAIDLRLDEWMEIGRPWGLAPVDAKAETLRTIRANVKRLNDRARAAKRRAASGARPREQSIAALARELGVSRPTVYARMKAAGCKTAAEYREHLAFTVSSHVNNKEQRSCDENVKRSSAAPAAHPPSKPITFASARPMPPRVPMALRFHMFAVPAPRLHQNSGGSRHGT